MHKTNGEVHEALKQAVLDKLLAQGISVNSFSVGKFEINYFSICFWINYKGDNGNEGVYVKIPKCNMYFEGENRIMPLSEADKKMAKSEYQSLQYVSANWPKQKSNIKFVEPLWFIPEFNAIVTKRVFSEDYFRTFRRNDLLGRVGIKSAISNVSELMKSFGSSLADFHSMSSKEVLYNYKPLCDKINDYAMKMVNVGGNGTFIKNITELIKQFNDISENVLVATTLKGIDIRNVLLDRDDNIHILDPGKIKWDCAEADIARFIVTVRILYWGSLWFFLRMVPAKAFENNLLQGYCGVQDIPRKRLLSLFMLKEFLKHWHMANMVLKKKSWPKLMKKILKSIYIDPFYRQQIYEEAALIKGSNDE